MKGQAEDNNNKKADDDVRLGRTSTSPRTRE